MSKSIDLLIDYLAIKPVIEALCNETDHFVQFTEMEVAHFAINAIYELSDVNSATESFGELIDTRADMVIGDDGGAWLYTYRTENRPRYMALFNEIYHYFNRKLPTQLLFTIDDKVESDPLEVTSPNLINNHTLTVALVPKGPPYDY